MPRRDYLDLEDTGRRLPEDGPFAGHPVFRLRSLCGSPLSIRGRGRGDRGISWSRVEESYGDAVPGCVVLVGQQGGTYVVEGTAEDISSLVTAAATEGTP